MGLGQGGQQLRARLPAMEAQRAGEGLEQGGVGREQRQILSAVEAEQVEGEPRPPVPRDRQRLEHPVEPLLETVGRVPDRGRIEAASREEQPGDAVGPVHGQGPGIDPRLLHERRDLDDGQAGRAVEFRKIGRGGDQPVHAPVDPAHPQRDVEILDDVRGARPRPPRIPFGAVGERRRAPAAGDAGDPPLGEGGVVVADHRRDARGIDGAVRGERPERPVGADRVEPLPAGPRIADLPCLDVGAAGVGRVDPAIIGAGAAGAEQDDPVAERAKHARIVAHALRRGVAVGQFEAAKIDDRPHRRRPLSPASSRPSG